MAADLGDFEALNIYTVMVDDKEFDYGNKKKEILQLYKKAADSGSYCAMFNYATELLNTGKTEENKQKAAKYFKKAADLGNLPSILKYDFMLYKNYGVIQNKKEAMRYMERAINLGNNGKKIEFFVILPNDSGILVKKNDIIQFFINILDTQNIDEIIDGKISSPVFGKMCSQEAFMKHIKDKSNDYDINILLCIGSYFLKQDTDLKSKDLGVMLIKQAADRGNAIAMVEYAKLCLSENNRKECLMYFIKVADLPISDENSKKGFSLYEELEKYKQQLKSIQNGNIYELF